MFDVHEQNIVEKKNGGPTLAFDDLPLTKRRAF